VLLLRVLVCVMSWFVLYFCVSWFACVSWLRASWFACDDNAGGQISGRLGAFLGVRFDYTRTGNRTSNFFGFGFVEGADIQFSGSEQVGSLNGFTVKGSVDLPKGARSKWFNPQASYGFSYDGTRFRAQLKTHGTSQLPRVKILKADGGIGFASLPVVVGWTW